MKMARGHILLLFLTFLFLASSLHLGNYRRLKLRTLAEIKNGHLSHIDPNNQKSDLSRRSQRALENKTRNQTVVIGTYINCVINTDSKNRPHYDCKYSPDVKVNWTHTDGRLIGTLSTSFACAKRRSVRNKMQSPQNEVDSGTGKQLIRDKRRTVYRDDAEAEEAPAEEEEAMVEAEEPPAEPEEPPLEEAQQIEEEENVVPEEKVVTEEEDIIEEDSKVPTNPEEDTPDEDDNGPPPDNAEENENEIEDEADTADTEVPVEEDDLQPEEKVEEDENEGGIENESKKGNNDDKNADKIDTVEGNDDKDTKDKNCNKADGSKCGTNDDYDSILVPIQQDIETLVSESEMPLFTQFILDLLYEAGDYLIALLIRNLQVGLRERRIAEKFERKVEMLSQEHGNDTAKAMEIVEKRIHEQLGKSYQLQILEFLKQLYDTWKQ